MINKLAPITCLILFISSCNFGPGTRSSGSGPFLSTDRPVNGNSRATSASYETNEYNQQTALTQVNASTAYAEAEKYKGSNYVAGSSINIVVADSGAEFSNPNLITIYRNYTGDNIRNNYSLGGTNDNPSYLAGEAEHGAIVAQIAAGEKDEYSTHGIAYNARVIPLKMLDQDHGNTYGNMAIAIDYAIAKNAKIINWSLGSGSDITPVQSKLATNQMFIAAAAGNASGSNPDDEASFANNTVNTLTAAGRLLAVAALEDNSTTVIASYSNQCGSLRQWCITAPGYAKFATLSPTLEFNTGHGTSYAAPLVSGSMAILLSMWPQLSISQATEILLRSAFPIYGVGETSLGRLQGENSPSKTSTTFGWGRLDIGYAMQTLGPTFVTTATTLSAVNYNAAIASSQNISSSGISTSPLFINSLQNSAILSRVMALDEYNRDFYYNLNDNIKVRQVMGDIGSYLVNTSNISTSNTNLNILGISTSFSMMRNDLYLAPNQSPNKNLALSSSVHNSINRNYAMTDINVTGGGGASFAGVQNINFNLQNKNGQLNMKASLMANPKFISQASAIELKDGQSNNLLYNITNNLSSNLFNYYKSGPLENSYYYMMGSNASNFALSSKLGNFTFGFNLLSSNLTRTSSLNNGSLYNYGADISATNMLSLRDIDRMRKNNLAEVSANWNSSNTRNAIKLTFGNFVEKNSMLDSFGSGVLASRGSKTNYFSINSYHRLHSNISLLSYFSQGQTQTAFTSDTILKDISNISTNKASLGLSFHDNNRNSSLTFIYSQPQNIRSGRINLEAPVGLASDNETIIRKQETIYLAGKTIKDYEASYQTKLTTYKDTNLSINFVRHLEPFTGLKRSSSLFLIKLRNLF